MMTNQDLTFDEKIKKEQMIEAFMAFAEVQRKMLPVRKTARNDYYKSFYAPLAEVMSAFQDTFGAAGFLLNQHVTDDGSRMVTSIIHAKTGVIIDSSMPFVLPGNSAKEGGGRDHQKMGIALTYFKRQGILLATGLVADDDTDGEPEVVQRVKHGPEQATAAASRLAGSQSLAELKQIWMALPAAIKRHDAAISAKECAKARLASPNPTPAPTPANGDFEDQKLGNMVPSPEQPSEPRQSITEATTKKGPPAADQFSWRPPCKDGIKIITCQDLTPAEIAKDFGELDADCFTPGFFAAIKNYMGTPQEKKVVMDAAHYRYDEHLKNAKSLLDEFVPANMEQLLKFQMPAVQERLAARMLVLLKEAGVTEPVELGG